MHLSRRSFCALAAVSFAGSRAVAQGDRASARPDVAAIDRDRTLRLAESFLSAPLLTITQTSALRASGATLVGPNDLIVDDDLPTSALPTRGDAFLAFTRVVPALAAAAYLQQVDDPSTAGRYVGRAAAWTDAWLSAPATRMNPTFAYARLDAETHAPQPEGVAEGAALAEVAKAIPVLVSAGAVSAAQQAAWHAWFRDLAAWLDTARLAGLARDSKDHVASSWLLLRISCASLLNDDAALGKLRHQFRTVTLRAQIRADGTFPHELSTPLPYRNSLFNLDLLAASADLLSTRFESAWNYELQDGPGMRAAIARHAPLIANRGSWPYPADTRLFTQLPCRRPALLLAARALQQAEYATIWRSLSPAEPTSPTLLRAFPLRQPLLWTVRPRLSAATVTP